MQPSFICGVQQVLSHNPTTSNYLTLLLERIKRESASNVKIYIIMICKAAFRQYR